MEAVEALFEQQPDVDGINSRYADWHTGHARAPKRALQRLPIQRSRRPAVYDAVGEKAPLRRALLQVLACQNSSLDTHGI